MPQEHVLLYAVLAFVLFAVAVLTDTWIRIRLARGQMHPETARTIRSTMGTALVIVLVLTALQIIVTFREAFFQ